MTRPILLIIIIAVISSCKKDPNYCEEARSKLLTQSFYGWIRICNAQPPDQIDIKGSAFINPIDEDQISIRVVSDSTFMDTSLLFKISCIVVETDYPITFIEDANGTEVGQYNMEPDRLSFSFGYPNCLNNTGFNGLLKQ